MRGVFTRSGLCILLACLCFLPTASIAATTPAIPGDVNGDGRVDIQDVALLLRAAEGLIHLTAPELARAHVAPLSDRDSPVALADVNWTLRYVLGLLPISIFFGGPAVRTVAGSGKSSTLPAGFADGGGATALFGEPYNIAGGPSGNLYVADRCNNVVRGVSPSGDVWTLAGRRVPAVGPAIGGYQDGPGQVARFSSPEALAVAPDESVYVADTYNDRVRRIDTEGNVSTVAGDGQPGFRDGPALSAHIDHPRAITISPTGEVIIADSTDRIRALSLDGWVRTIAGSGPRGMVDGPALTARLNRPRGLAYGPDGELYIADCQNGAIRKLTPDGVLTTVAGNGHHGTQDGVGASAEFEAPMGLGVDADGNLWVADWTAETIRKVTPDGKVTTVAGQPFQQGLVDGPALMARFDSPMGLWVGPDGKVWIADTDNQRIRVLEP